MKGTLIDFLDYLTENEELRREVVRIANKHGFEFDDQVSDVELDAVAGGADATPSTGSTEQPNKRQEYMTAFENFDQKTNQLFNILSTVQKNMKEMQTGVTQNIV
jgi:hypothetical protein